MLTRHLPALILPAILTASTAAHAALDVSNGFLTAKQPTTVGFDFTLGLNAKLVNGATTRATSIELTCSVYTTAHRVECDGDLTVQGDTTAIRMGFVQGTAYWSISADSTAIQRDAHEQWGQEVLPNTISLPYPWTSVSFQNGGQWRRFYYTCTWAQTFYEITGLPYSEVTDIWTW